MSVTAPEAVEAAKPKRKWELPPLSEHLSLAETPLAVIDLETTGLTPAEDEIVEVAIVGLSPDGAIDFEFETLVRPLGSVGVTEAVHGLSDKDLEGAPTFAELAGQVGELLDGRVLCGHNLYFFDLPFLRQSYKRAGGWFPFAAATDTMRVGASPFTALSAVCAEWDVIYPEDAHSALADARVVAELFQRWVREAREQGVESWAHFKVRGELLRREKMRAGEGALKHPPVLIRPR